MKRILSATLAVSLTLQAGIPMAFAEEKPRDTLGEAFGNLKRFARESETPIPTPTPLRESEPLAVSTLARVEETEEPAESLSVLPAVRVDNDGASHHLAHESALVREIANVVHGLAPQIKSVQVTLEDTFYPSVTTHVMGRRHANMTLRLSFGTLALVENRDEFAALIAQALSRHAPQVFAHRDDPRIMRRLDEQLGFESLPAEAKAAIKADLSAIERLRGCDRRPWALSDYERRVFHFFSKQWSKKFAYWMARKSIYAERIEKPFWTDDLFEARLLAQKIAVGYMQERENLRELIKSPSEFTPELRALHREARRETNDFLRPFGFFITMGKWASVVVTPLAAFALNSGVVLEAYLHPSQFFDLAHPGAVTKWIAALLIAREALDAAIYKGAGVVAQAFHDGVVGFFSMLLDGVIFILTKVGEGLMYVCEPIAKIVGWAFEATINGVWWALVGVDHWLELAFGSHYPLILIPAAFLIPTLWYFRGVVKELGQLAGQGAHDTARYFAGRASRWLGIHSIERILLEDSSGLPEAERFLRVAKDLRALWSRSVYTSYETARAFDPKSLDVLGHQSWIAYDTWGVTKQFLRVFAQRADANAFTAPELIAILNVLVPPRKGVEFRPENPGWVTAVDDLVLKFLNAPRARVEFAALYRAVKKHFPQNLRPLRTYPEATPWIDFDESSLNLQVLAFARLANEIESLGEGYDFEDFLRLNELIYNRLAIRDLTVRMNRKALPWIMKAAFQPGLDRDLTEGVAQTLLTHKGGGLRGDGQETDLWPTLKAELGWYRAGALAAGDLDRSVAIATWESSAEMLQPSLLQAPGLVARFLNWPLRNSTKHLTEGAFFLRLRKLQSVREVIAYVERDLLGRGALLEPLIPILFSELIAHPEWIRGREDVDALLGTEIFWPLQPIGPTTIGGQAAEIFNYVFRKFRDLDEGLYKAMVDSKGKRSRAWTWDPTLAQQLHRLIVKRLEALGEFPQAPAELEELWHRLTDRGVTPETDRLMHLLIASASSDHDRLIALATSEGRVWETELHSQLALARAKKDPDFLRLIQSKVDDPHREKDLAAVIRGLQESLPERGLAFARFLEDLSVRIDSTYDEAKQISQAKGDTLRVQSGDSNLVAVREVFRDVARWPKSEQFAFVRFLRGEVAPSPRLIAAFPRLGLDRVQRMYEILPLAARVGLFDTFFTHGLIGTDGSSEKWVRRLSRHIVGGQKTEAQIVTLQVLTAFLFAIREVGNHQMTTTILSYLYALPSSAVASPVEVLKQVLEIFGATGIKVGQFIYASQILGDSGQILRSLQSRARVPERIEMYEDVYDLLGVPVGTPLPFSVLQLLGAASMKYAFMGEDRATLQNIVVKIFRLDAMNNVELQFDVLEHMSRYLLDHFGPKYGVLKIIVKMARLAVKREGRMSNEIRRSRIARHHVYKDLSTEGIHVEVPREDLINARMIIAQYAEGVAFDDLPDRAKPMFAKLLVEIEERIYFADQPVIRFDPDRHAGNAQMLLRVDPHGEIELKGDEKHGLHPIDFGQLLRMSSAQRERITKLFALAQIAGRVRPNAWTAGEISKLLGLDPAQAERLRENLKAYVKSSAPTAVALYVSVLAALEASGFEIVDTSYLDFVRGIIQITQFERFAPDAKSPRATFEVRVRDEIKRYFQTFEYEDHELTYIKAHNAVQEVKRQLTGGEVRLIPTDLSQVDFEELIRRERGPGCEAALERAG